MKDHFCEFLQLDIAVSFDLFDMAAYLDDIKESISDKRKVYGWTYGSKDNPKEQHAHIITDFRKPDRYRFRITYHATGTEEEDVRPPYMEDCAQWLGGFLKQEVPASLSARFFYNENYFTVIALPFPLLSPNEDLAGSQVVGMRIKLPRSTGIKTAIIQQGKTKPSLFLDSDILIDLKGFNLGAQITGLSKMAMKFIKRTGGKDETE